MHYLVESIQRQLPHVEKVTVAVMIPPTNYTVNTQDAGFLKIHQTSTPAAPPTKEMFEFEPEELEILQMLTSYWFPELFTCIYL